MRLPSVQARLFSLVALTAVAVAVNLLAVSPASGNGAETQTTFSGSTTGAVVYSSNDGSGTGLEGVTGTTAGGQAVYGIANNSLNAAFGVHGKVFGPSSTGLFGEAVNTDAGHPSIGLFGFSNSGYGIYAQSALGTSSALYAKNTNATSGSAVQALAAGDSIIGESTKSAGVVGQTDFLSTTTVNAKAGVMGIDNEPSTGFNSGVVGRSTFGTGGYFSTVGGSNRPALRAIQTNSSAGPAGSALIAEVAAGTNPGIEIDAHGNAAYPFGAFVDTCACFVAYITSGGDMHLTGHITTAGGTLIATRTASGRNVMAYSPRSSVPTIEDFGQAQLLNGRASVNLDPSFAQAIDRSRAYLVFLTPRADNRGLYVAAQSLTGFVVRESQGGRSTLVFDYRIVARPFASNEARLPFASEAGPMRNVSGAAYPTSAIAGSLRGQPIYHATIPRALPLPPMIQKSVERDVRR